MAAMIQMISQFIEKLSESDVSYDDRIGVYDCLLETLDEFEIRHLDECLDIDKAFDESWHERYVELTTEEDT